MRDSVRDALRRQWPVLVLLAVSATATAEPLFVSIEVKSRETAPGEPIRIAVSSPWPILDIEGEFLGQSLFWVRDDDGDDGERWSAWTMVGLDQEPGKATVEVRGMTTGEPFFASLPTEIRAKEFPQERLEVAPSYVEPPPEVRERLAAERARLVEIYRTRRPTQPTEPFIRPVPGAQTSIFGTRRVFNGKPRSPHSGLDLRAASGTEVVASGPGRVVLAEDLYYSGNTVIIDHGSGLFTLYAHLKEIRVAADDPAGAGQLVGLSGATGRVTGPHLHWGAKIGDRPFDPTALLDRRLFE